MNIFIIEDDVYLASQIKETFLKYGFANRVEHIASYGDFLQKWSYIASFDIILLDINLWISEDEKDGFDILSYIRKKNKNVPIIMISSHSEYSFLEEAFAKWAHDYIVKPFRTRELQIRIERWFRNYVLSEYFTTSKILEYHNLVYDISAYEFYMEKKPIPLSKWNKYLFSLFFIYREKLLDHDVLVEKIWWYDDGTSEKNLRIKIMRLKEQLKPLGIDHWIQTARGEGYMFKKIWD